MVAAEGKRVELSGLRWWEVVKRGGRGKGEGKGRIQVVAGRDEVSSECTRYSGQATLGTCCTVLYITTGMREGRYVGPRVGGRGKCEWERGGGWYLPCLHCLLGLRREGTTSRNVRGPTELWRGLPKVQKPKQWHTLQLIAGMPIQFAAERSQRCQSLTGGDWVPASRYLSFYTPGARHINGRE